MAVTTALGEALAGRSLTWPSPTSMTRQAPSARCTRSAVTNGRLSEAIRGANGARSNWPGGRSHGVSGCAVTSRHVPSTHFTGARQGGDRPWNTGPELPVRQTGPPVGQLTHNVRPRVALLEATMNSPLVTRSRRRARGRPQAAKSEGTSRGGTTAIFRDGTASRGAQPTRENLPSLTARRPSVQD
jgi:hypothetical protein